MIHIFASAPLPPLSFSFSPPSSLFLSSLLVLCRPAAALCCRDGLRDVTEGWSGPLIGAGGGEKWGEDKEVSETARFFCFFQHPSVFRSRLCQRVCVCMLCRFTAAAPLFPCNEFYATSGVRVQQGASAAVKTQEKIGYTPGCPLPVVHGCCHEHRCELSWTPGLGLCVYVCALAEAFVAVR